MLHLVPPLVSFLGHRPDLKLEAFHRLHTLFCGAAPLGPSAANRLVERLGKYDLLMQEGNLLIILKVFFHICTYRLDFPKTVAMISLHNSYLKTNDLSFAL